VFRNCDGRATGAASGRLGRRIDAGDLEAAEAMRDLAETVTVSRDTSRPGGVEADIAGRLNALLGAQPYPNGVKGVWGNMVAEERHRRYRAATTFAC